MDATTKLYCTIHTSTPYNLMSVVALGSIPIQCWAEMHHRQKKVQWEWVNNDQQYSISVLLVLNIVLFAIVGISILLLLIGDSHHTSHCEAHLQFWVFVCSNCHYSLITYAKGTSNITPFPLRNRGNAATTICHLLCLWKSSDE